MANTKKKSAVNDHVKKNRAKYVKLRAELDAAIESEKNPKRLRKLVAKQQECIDKEERYGLDPITVAILIAIIQAVLKWWLKEKGR